MTPEERHLHDAQVSLHRQQQLLDGSQIAGAEDDRNPSSPSGG